MITIIEGEVNILFLMLFSANPAINKASNFNEVAFVCCLVGHNNVQACYAPTSGHSEWQSPKGFLPHQSLEHSPGHSQTTSLHC